MRNKLRESNLSKLPTGIHSDGDGLFLRVQKSGSRNWVFITRKLGKRTEIGIGGMSGTAPVGLNLARRKAETIRQQLAEGIDPRSSQKPQIITFKYCMDGLLQSKENDWTNEKHKAQWHMTLNKYAEPLHQIPISDIVVGDVKSCLLPHWTERPETAYRLRSRIQAVIDYGIAHQWRTQANPAVWKGLLDKVMPARSKESRRHHAALSYTDAPVTFSKLRELNSVSSRFVEFLGLTCVRFGEANGAQWSEIDFEEKVWRIPADRMKAGKEHHVPLVKRAIKLLRIQEGLASSRLIFEGGTHGRPISNTACTKTLRSVSDGNPTLHGLRSTFRDWAGDQTDYPREIAEAVLAHAVGNAVEQAYRRKDAFDKRRQLMNDWEVFLNGKTS